MDILIGSLAIGIFIVFCCIGIGLAFKISGND